MRPASELVDSGSEWYDTRPSYWQLARLNHVATTWPSNLDKHTVPNQPAVRLCNYVDVYKNDEIDENIEFMRATATPDQVERFRLKVGDTLLTKDSETADDIGIPAFVSYEAADLVCGYHLSIVRPRVEAVFPRYLFWALGSMPVFDQWAVLASGVTRVGIRAGDLAKAAILLPPMDEQRAIANFLDRETARIDTLIEEQQRLIVLLHERRAATVADATGWGTHRQSGWGSYRLSWLFGSTASGTTPSNEDIDYSGDADIPWVTTGELRESVILGSERGVSREVLEKYSALRLHPVDTLLIAMYGATIGRMAVLGIPATSNQACCALIGAKGTTPDFVQYSLTAAKPFLLLEAAGGGQPNINQDKIRSFRIPVPPLEKQHQIVEYLDKQTTKIDTLIAEAEQFIELSQERRAALITAAVTGQIDVRDEVA